MRNRMSQSGSVHNGKECIFGRKKKQGDCTYCPANHNENSHGHHSQWGRKVAAKTQYATGKGRNERYLTHKKYWDGSAWDKRYAEIS